MTIRRSLLELIRAFNNLLSHLVRSYPLFFFISLFIVGLTVYYLFGTEGRIVVFLSILITLVSLILYMYNDNYTEAFLTFFLGILTVFTIEWDSEKTITFIISYFILNVFMLIGGSIKLNSQIETILMNSARYYDESDIKGVYKKLRKVVDRPTAFRQIRIIEKCEIVNFLSFLKVPISSLPKAIDRIERFKTLTRADLSTSLKLFKLIFLTVKVTSKNDDEIDTYVRFHINSFLELPLTPDQMIYLFTETKTLFLQRKIELNDYYSFLRLSFLRGVSEHEVISQLRSRYKLES